MDDDERDLPGDDEPVGMTMGERTVWAYLVTVVITSGVYFTIIGLRLADQPVDEVAWVAPMLWTIGASILGSMILTIVLTIAGTIRSSITRSVAAARAGRPGPVRPSVDIDSGSDARDKDINLIGDRAGVTLLAAGVLGALVLAMLDADTFWIGNLLFAFGTLGAIVETTTKIRLYRRGF